jgi:hypothetical protein
MNDVRTPTSGRGRAAVAAGRHDDVACTNRAAGGVESPRVAVAFDALDARPGAHVEPFPVGVLAEVLEQAVAGDPATEAAGDAPSREPGEEPRGVQVQPVVAPAPGGARLGARFDEQRLEAGAAQQRSGGEARRAGADDHEVACLHDGGHTIKSHPIRPPKRWEN